jgi:selenocysteine-specific elongation factor
MIVGTAGHIDHGKTSLVRRLTGIDTDRLPEEKRRGMTIDLGFAHMELEGVGEVGVVDVPGHERFIRNMVAGATGIDLALLVVAADDGVMPQTREHLDIIGLLGITTAVVAISKTDLVSAERIAVATNQIRRLLEENFLASAPIVPVSAETGEGLEVLRKELARSLTVVRSKSQEWPFWLAVDRVFVAPGFGAVVTGTIASGRVSRNEHLRLLPGGQAVRVRGVQVHDRPVDLAVAGNRCALNLAGIDKHSISRGMVVCESGLTRVATTVDAQVTLIKTSETRLKNHARVRLHNGSAEVMARVQWLERTMPEPGGRGFAQFRFDEPIPLLYGQRYILRDETAQRTLGGGIVLDPFAARRGAQLPERLERLKRLSALNPDTSLTVWLEARGVEGWLFPELAEQLAESPRRLEERISLRDDVWREDIEGTLWIGLRSAVEALGPQLLAATQAYLSDHRGITAAPVATLHSMVCQRLDLRVFRSLLERLVRRAELESTTEGVRPIGHRQQFSPEDAALANRVEELLTHKGNPPPKLDALATATGVPVPRLRRFLGELERAGRVNRLMNDVYVTRRDLIAWRDKAQAYLQQHERMTAAQFRDEIGIGRGLAILVLERLDRDGVTRRVGDARVSGSVPQPQRQRV